MPGISDEELHKLSRRCDEIRGNGPVPEEVYYRLLDGMAKVPLKEEMSCVQLTNMRMRHSEDCPGCDVARFKFNAYNKKSRQKARQRKKDL